MAKVSIKKAMNAVNLELYNIVYNPNYLTLQFRPKERNSKHLTLYVCKKYFKRNYPESYLKHLV